MFRWIRWCRIVFRLFLLVGGMLLLRFGSKVTTWWSLNLCGCSWGCSVLSWILLLDWLDGLILAWVYCCPIEVWYVALWNTLFAESPFFAEIFIFIMQGPSSIMARNSMDILFLLLLSVLNFWGMFVRVYPKIVQGLTFLNSVKHITIILAHCTS